MGWEGGWRELVVVVGFSWIGAGYRFNSSRPLRYDRIVFIVVNTVRYQLYKHLMLLSGNINIILRRHI